MIDASVDSTKCLIGGNYKDAWWEGRRSTIVNFAFEDIEGHFDHIFISIIIIKKEIILDYRNAIIQIKDIMTVLCLNCYNLLHFWKLQRINCKNLK